MLAEYKTEEWPRTDALTDGRGTDGLSHGRLSKGQAQAERERDDVGTVGARLAWMGL